MAKTELDSFEGMTRNYLRFKKSTMIPAEPKAKIFGRKKESTKQSIQFQFGINLKKDNQHKTKQLKLF